MNFEIKALENGIYIAELFHGKTGTAEDYTGSDIPGGYIRVIEAVYARLVSDGHISDGTMTDIAAPTSLWVSATLQAKQAGVPIMNVICPFASMPWKDDALVTIGIVADAANDYCEKIKQTENYSLYPRVGAAGLALDVFRREHGSTAPALVLATQAPENS